MKCVRLSPENSALELQQLLDTALPGDLYQFAPGTYRCALRMTQSGTAEAPIRIEAEQAGTVVLTGADVVESWIKAEEYPGQWVAELDVSHLPPEPKYGLLDGRREQLFVDGMPYRQVLNAEDMLPGCFRVDAGKVFFVPQAFTGEIREGQLEIDAMEITGGGTQQIDRSSPANCWQFLLKDFNPAHHCIEVTTRKEIFVTGQHDDHSSVGYLEIRGLSFRASADAPQQSMVRFCGHHLLIEDCLFEYGNARGFDLRTDDSVMRGCVTRLNSQMGFSGYGDRNLMENCALLYNNTQHSSFVCFEQGGCKICRTGEWTLRNIRCVGNDGPGIWFDIDNHDAVIENCWCERNSGPGIMYEISHDAVIRNNVCVANGHAAQKDVRLDRYQNSVGAEEQVYGQGILVQMSRNTQVLHNTCVGNARCGIELRHHPYQQAGFEGHSSERYILRDNLVKNNLLVDNGWDNLAITTQPRNPVKADEVRDNLHDYNFFHSSCSLRQYGGNLIAYSRSGKVQANGTMSLEEWRASSHQDLNSLQWDPLFVAREQGDYRLEPQSPALAHGERGLGVDQDFLGNPRPEAPAMGAFESCTLSAASLLRSL